MLGTTCFRDLSWQPFLVWSRLKTRINAAQCRHHNKYHNFLKVLSETIVPKLYQNDSKRTKTCSLEICGMLFASFCCFETLFITVHSWLNEAAAESCPDHGSHVSPACLGVDQFASCWAVPTVPRKKFRSSREALICIYIYNALADPTQLQKKNYSTRCFFLQVHPSQDETGPAAMDLLAFECIRAQAGSSRFCGKLVWGPCRRALKCSSHSSLNWWLQS